MSKTTLMMQINIVPRVPADSRGGFKGLWTKVIPFNNEILEFWQENRHFKKTIIFLSRKRNGKATNEFKEAMRRYQLSIRYKSIAYKKLKRKFENREECGW